MRIWTIACFLALPGKVMANNNHSVSEFSEIAGPLAGSLAPRLAQKLRAERVDVVFLKFETGDCSGTVENASSLCELFGKQMERLLLDRKISFLPEDKQEVLRQKLANEASYQQSSMMVNEEKAVELGKQSAIGAYVSLSVTVGANQVTADAKSLSMAKGVYTIVESARINYEKRADRSWVQIGGAGVLLTSGAYAAYTGFAAEARYSNEADKAYNRYRTATSGEEASRERDASTELDKKSAHYGDVGRFGVAALLGGLAYWYFARTDVFYYESDSGTSAGARNDSLLRIESQVTVNGLLGALTYEF